MVVAAVAAGAKTQKSIARAAVSSSNTAAAAEVVLTLGSIHTIPPSPPASRARPVSRVVLTPSLPRLLPPGRRACVCSAPAAAAPLFPLAARC